MEIGLDLVDILDTSLQFRIRCIIIIDAYEKDIEVFHTLNF
jgi:hypothetical protein